MFYPTCSSALRLFLLSQVLVSLTSAQGNGPKSEPFNPVHLANKEINQSKIKAQAAASLEDLAGAQNSRLQASEDTPDPAEPQEGPVYSSVIVSKDTWEVFEAAVGIESKPAGENPVYILVEAAKSIAMLCVQLDSVARNIKRINNSPDREGPQAHPQFFRAVDNLIQAIQPVYNYYPKVLDGEGKEIKGLIGKGGFIDPAWGTTNIFLKARLRELLGYEEVAKNTILVSDSVLLKAFFGLGRLGTVISQRAKELQNVMKDIKKDFPEDTLGIALGYPKRSPEGSRRQDIGYFPYYQQRYMSGFASRYATGIDDKGKMIEEPFLSWSTAKRIDFKMYQTVLTFANRISVGNIPLMMEMILDILLAGNIFLGRRSIYPDYEFGIPWPPQTLPGTWDAISWLKTYPEFESVASTPRKSLFYPSPDEFLLAEGHHDPDPLAPEYISFGRSGLGQIIKSSAE
ncbi:hypothetical protein TWF481_010658 [Arthrobotrys musiformis]|uniref:Uncharacterized protein n=1 Tax=Arthrobotrys musiformis TaxID=47236 RepID=A0AAV9W2Q6_9PEZI